MKETHHDSWIWPYLWQCFVSWLLWHIRLRGPCISLSALISELLKTTDDLSCRAFDVHVIPYGAIGGLLSCESLRAGQDSSSQAPLLHGQAFCSLPITPTGLPVHVNGES